MGKPFKAVWLSKKYSPHVCETLIEHFKTGGTIASFCELVDISESCFKKWVKQFQEFTEAYDKAKTFKRAYHNRELTDNLENQAINTTVYKYYMRLVVDADDPEKPNVTVNNLNNVDNTALKDEIKQWQEKYKSDY